MGGAGAAGRCRRGSGSRRRGSGCRWAGGPDKIEQLKELAGLKDAGILTEEEFAAERAKILAG